MWVNGMGFTCDFTRHICFDQWSCSRICHLQTQTWLEGEQVSVKVSNQHRMDCLLQKCSLSNGCSLLTALFESIYGFVVKCQHHSHSRVNALERNCLCTIGTLRVSWRRLSEFNNNVLSSLNSGWLGCVSGRGFGSFNRKTISDQHFLFAQYIIHRIITSLKSLSTSIDYRYVEVIYELLEMFQMFTFLRYC